MKWKRNLMLLFMLLAGVVVGSLIATAAAKVPFLTWLGYGASVGISTGEPMLLDLAVLQIAFGFQFQINVAQIICIILAICMYKGLAHKL